MKSEAKSIVAAAAMLAVPFAALGDIFFDGEHGFSCVRAVNNARCEYTNDAIVFSDIRRDLQIHCRIPGVEPAKVESFEFRYRYTGGTPHPKSGGELYYASPGASFSDARRWLLPPLVRDGEWHVMTVPLSSVVDLPDWRGSCNVSSFRFDATNAEGGKLEISRFGFRTHGSAATGVTSNGVKFGDEDAWPDVKPESVKTGVPRRPAVPSVEVLSRGGTAVPRVQTAGGKVRLRYDYRGPVPDVAFLPVTVSLLSPKGTLKWSEALHVPLASSLFLMGDDVWAIEFDYELPRYIGSGEVSVRCESPCILAVGGRTAAARLDIRGIEIDPDWPEKLVAKVALAGETPTFCLNGKNVYPLWGTVFRGHREDRPVRHSSAPLNFVTVWTDHLEWWPRGDVFDPTDLDRIAEQHRRAYPGAYFIWDISVYPPPDWRMANPDDVARDEKGRMNFDGGDEKVNFSFASRKAYDDMEAVVRKVIDHLECSPYANRIAGYRINSGHTVEWLGWDPTRRDAVLDFSPVAQKGFESFARERYPWISDFSVPTLAERRALDDGAALWDERRHARAVAYHDFYSAAVADGAIRLCRAAREKLGGRKLVGTYFGYVMTLNGDGKSQMRAHFATKRFLDYYSFVCRQPGTQITDMKPFASIQRHGIVSVIEEDTRTHNMPARSSNVTLTEEMTVNIERRNMGVAICRNQPFYTYAITHGTEFDFPQFADDTAILAVAGAHAVKTGVRRGAEIAVVVSEEAVKSTPVYDGVGSWEVYAGRKMQTYDRDGSVRRSELVGGRKNATFPYNYIYTELSRIGAGVDYLLAEDMADNPGDYKFYIFNVCTKLTPALRKAAERLRKRDCTILWLYAPGYTSADGNSVANMKALTGMDFELCPDVTDPGVTLADGRNVGGVSVPKGGTPLKPIFAAAKPDRVLGRYANGAAGLAEVRTGAARTIFSGSYYVEAPFLKEVAKSAGVHLFSEGLDVCEANTRFVSLHVRTAGLKTIRLPRKTTVVDVFNRRLVSRNVDAFTFEASLHSSWLFYYGDDAEKLLDSL